MSGKTNIVSELQQQIQKLEGFKPVSNIAVDFGLGPLGHVFPNGSFPLGCVHEFLSVRVEDSACTGGFISALLASLMGNSGTSLWISASRKIFPPALRSFGVQPDRVIFIDLKKEKDVLWAMDEALKCGALTAVIGEIREVSFTESRRLQLAVEHSQVNGFILRRNVRNVHPTACVSRWKISNLPSQPIDNLPGIGFPSWRVELLKIRNGRTGSWDLQWMNGKFQPVLRELSADKAHEYSAFSKKQSLKAG